MEQTQIDLMEAIHSGDVKKVTALLDSGTDPNFICEVTYDWYGEADYNNISPLNEAVTVALKYAEEIPERSNRRKVEYRESCIPDTVSVEDMKKIIEVLLSHGANPHEVSLLNVFDSSKNKQMTEEFIRLLVENGADNYTDQMWGDYFIMKVLTDFGTNGLFDVLIANGFDVNMLFEDNGLRLIYIVIEKGSEDMLRGLIEKGADVNVSLTGSCGSMGYEEGDTPLIVSLKNKYGSADMAMILLDKGADHTPENGYGQSALTFAERNGFDSVAERIQAIG